MPNKKRDEKPNERDLISFKDQVRQWKAGMEAVNAFDLEQARLRTPAVRFALLQIHIASLSQMGLLKERTDNLDYHIRWQELRERMIARGA